ncbi:thermonuclease family protein [Flavobacterium sp.]|uniref:thermonuclease family protein n=1 Tax=Flavobacterium sp. TaxID=239 RepID=UPI001B6B2C37|nr:thermonuclease family protein [Flavobacterium sp.]MBP6182918.1 thermonuclease family protein [Flavobacterium sp.]
MVRFAHIDCPEKKQPYGKTAKYFVSDNCLGKNVKIIHNNNYDRYKRLIAEVILEDGTNLNKELIKQGLAWHFKKYSDVKEYSELENEAKINKIGLWSEQNQIPPWQWRK